MIVAWHAVLRPVRDTPIDRGRDDGIDVAPPSEPDRRFSRIRLSS